MWRHEWLEILLGNDDEDAVSDGDCSSNSSTQRNVVIYEWLQAISNE